MATHSEPHGPEVVAELNKFPDITTAGNLVFCGYMTRERLQKKFTIGIRKRGGEVETASYFPNDISLSATTTKGYKHSDGIQMGWTVLYMSAVRKGYYQGSHELALVLDPKWIESNIHDLLGVGGIFHKDMKRLAIAGAIQNLPIAEKIEDDAFLEEVHYKRSPIPPHAISGIIIHENSLPEIRDTLTLIREVVHAAYRGGFTDKSIAIYTPDGQIIEVIKK